ncbi:MAG TPA: hypothetical protein VN714_26715 [Trebonia sp.]|nr:hypothetical protein [Trebonia sp.]
MLRDIYSARDRRIAPSHGFDLIPVLRHAWRAWWLETGQYLLTVVVLGIWLATRPLDTLMALDLLVLGPLLQSRLRWFAESAGYGSHRDPASGRSEQIRDKNLHLRGVVLKRSLAWALGALVALVLISIVSQGTRATASAWAAQTGLVIAAIFTTLIAIPVAASVMRAWSATRLWSATVCERQRLGKRMRNIDHQQHHPFTVHSGFKPFLGSGKNMRSWSFAQRLVHASVAGGQGAEFQIPPFTACTLVDRLRERIGELRYEKNPETRLSGLDVADYVFVEGTRVGDMGAVLAAEPNSSAVTRAIAEAITNSGDAARHYLCARVVSWGGEVVTSVFVHASLQGRTLYLEFATYALLPIRSEYAVGKAGGTHGRKLGSEVFAAIVGLPAFLLETGRLARAPFTLWAAVRARHDRTPEAGRRSDIGAEFSIRETAMIEAPSKSEDESESSYFQFQDIAQHSKIIERRLIAAIEDYLEEVGVDSSEFVRRTTAILNNGIMNTGSGTISVDSSAVGANSTVLIQAENG